MSRKALILLVCMVWAKALWADQGPTAPVYNPVTKSYFQLFDDGHSSTWETARKSATAKSFKGVRGRLAVIDSIETHNFVLQKLGLRRHDSSVWIGLRYWCNARMLQWEGELPYEPSDAGHFRLWHNPWARASEDKGGASGMISTCGMTASRTQGFAPVYYRNIGGVVRWQATGAGKGFDSYLVEYVTNEE